MKISKTLSTFLFVLLINNFVVSQSQETQALIDSSWQVFHLRTIADSFANLALEKAVNENDFISQYDALKTLGRICEYYYLRDSALHYYEKALILSEAENKKKYISKIYVEMAYVKEELGQRDSAIFMIQNSFKIAEEINDSLEMENACLVLGYFYNNEGNHEKAIVSYLKSLKIAELLNDQKYIAAACQGVGIIYNKQRDFEKAQVYFKKSLKGYETLKDTSRILGVLNDFGILNKNKGNLLEAEKWYSKMLEIGKTKKYHRINTTAYNNLGNLYFEMAQFEKGVLYSQKGVDNSNASGNKRNESDGLNSLAKNQLALNLTDEAIPNLQRSLSLAREIKVLEKERDALLTLSTAYEKINNPRLALKYFKEHKVLYDSIYNANKTEQIHGLEKKYETVKKDKEITLLAQNAELEKVKNTRLWGALSLTILFGSFLFWQRIQKRKKEKEIEHEKQKVVELENLRLNQELDFKKQELTSKVLQLCRKNEFLQSLGKKIKDIQVELEDSDKKEIEKLSRQINRDMDADTDWEQFLKSFESVHPDFNNNISKTHPDFSKGEIRMACLLKMNLSTKDIANLLSITTAGVKKTRNRMRKKMEIDSSVNLTEYFMSLGLVHAVSN